MKELKLIGEGNTAKIYEYESGKILKLYSKNYDLSTITFELNNSVLFNQKFADSPKCYGIKLIEDCYGIIYDYVTGKTMLETFKLDDETLLDRFTELQKKYLKETIDKGCYYKDWLKLISRGNFIDLIDRLPDGNNLCHGDFHPGNVMITDDNKLIIIDFMNVCRAPFLYDIARTYFLFSTVNIEAANKYLTKMSIKKEDIKGFLEVITLTRPYELNII